MHVFRKVANRRGLPFCQRRRSAEGATEWRIGREPYLLCMPLYGSTVSATYLPLYLNSVCFYYLEYALLLYYYSNSYSPFQYLHFGTEQIAQGAIQATEALRRDGELCNRIIEKIKELVPAASNVRGRLIAPPEV